MEAESKPYRMVLNPGPDTDNDYKTKLTLDAAAGTLVIAIVVSAVIGDGAIGDIH